MPSSILGAVAAPIIGSVVGGLFADDNGAESLNAASTAASQQQAQISQEQWNRWKQTYAPFEDEFVSESRNTGSVANQNKNAQQAGADVASGFSKVREQLNEVPVNSPDARLREENRINLAEAATSAGAQSQARDATRAAGRAAEIDALSLGRNLPAQASTGLATASAGMGSAARWGQQRADAQAAGIGKMVGGMTGSQSYKDWVSGNNPATGVNSSVIPQGTPAVASGFVASGGGGGGMMDDLQSYGVF